MAHNFFLNILNIITYIFLVIGISGFMFSFIEVILIKTMNPFYYRKNFLCFETKQVYIEQPRKIFIQKLKEVLLLNKFRFKEMGENNILFYQKPIILNPGAKLIGFLSIEDIKENKILLKVNFKMNFFILFFSFFFVPFIWIIFFQDYSLNKKFLLIFLVVFFIIIIYTIFIFIPIFYYKKKTISFLWEEIINQGIIVR
jgi:hypothetical protein